MCSLARRLSVVAPPTERVAVSLSQLFEEHYRVEAMMDSTNPDSIADTRRTVRRFTEFVGSDALEDLTDSAVARFMEFMLDGRSPVTVNRFRAHLVALANHAYDSGLIDRPLRVRKLKTVSNPPAAWTEAE